MYVRLELEGPVVIYSDARTSEQAARLRDWIESSVERAELVSRAVELARLEPAA